MTWSFRSPLRCTAGILLALFAANSTHAAQGAPANYPERPIRFIVPAAPGGTTDTLARLFGERMTDVFNQQVVVDNRASASGVLAAEIVANSDPTATRFSCPITSIR